MSRRRVLVAIRAVLAVVLVVGGVLAAIALMGGDDAAPATATLTPSPQADATTDATVTPSACQVEYTVRDEWPGGLTVDVTIHNLAESLDGWSLAWQFAGDEHIESIWNATVESDDNGGADVVVRNVEYDAVLAAGGSTTFGFVGSGTSTAEPPAVFRLNDEPCGVGDGDLTEPAPRSTPDAADAGGSLYLNPDTQAAQAAAAASGETRTLLEKISASPQSFWVGEWNASIDAADAVRDYTTRADRAGAVGVLVVYAIPGRDCGYHSAGGVAGSDYAAWIDAVADAVVGQPWVVLEPDALAMLGDCDGQGDRVGYLRYAAEALTDAGARVYLDIGHSGWLSAEEAARRLNEVGLGEASGFALNTSNYQTTADSIAYGERVSALTGGATYVVDTSRNGNGSNGEWCNPRGRALGERPRLVDDDTHLDALLWVKLPGESDGSCNGGPPAGQWFGEVALELARNAAW